MSPFGKSQDLIIHGLDTQFDSGNPETGHQIESLFIELIRSCGDPD
jgi:hypothetical protein